MDYTLTDVNTRHEQILNWCKNNKVFYLKADILIPEAVENEVQEIYNNHLFTEHRSSDGRGWSSATLHGEEWNITHWDASKKDTFKWTKLADYAPEMTRWLKDDFPNNGRYSRCRFMLLSPGGYIRAHTDTHQWQEGQPVKFDLYGALNICITQPSNCYLRREEDKQEVPFKPREVYWFDNGPHHSAANFSRENRFHFIVHGGGNKARKELFIRSFEKSYPDADI